jgi:DNA-binding CsgD family transcriptional regulator
MQSEVKNLHKKRPQKFKPQSAHLIPSELRVVRLVCMQYTSQEIAEKLQLTLRTVEAYRASILKKIKAKNTAGIVIYALKNGLYKI